MKKLFALEPVDLAEVSEGDHLVFKALDTDTVPTQTPFVISRIDGIVGRLSEIVDPFTLLSDLYAAAAALLPYAESRAEDIGDDYLESQGDETPKAEALMLKAQETLMRARRALHRAEVVIDRADVVEDEPLCECGRQPDMCATADGKEQHYDRDFGGVDDDDPPPPATLDEDVKRFATVHSAAKKLRSCPRRRRGPTTTAGGLRSAYGFVIVMKAEENPMNEPNKPACALCNDTKQIPLVLQGEGTTAPCSCVKGDEDLHPSPTEEHWRVAQDAYEDGFGEISVERLAKLLAARESKQIRPGDLKADGKDVVALWINDGRGWVAPSDLVAEVVRLRARLSDLQANDAHLRKLLAEERGNVAMLEEAVPPKGRERSGPIYGHIYDDEDGEA